MPDIIHRNNGLQYGEGGRESIDMCNNYTYFAVLFVIRLCSLLDSLSAFSSYNQFFFFKTFCHLNNILNYKDYSWAYSVFAFALFSMTNSWHMPCNIRICALK